MKRPLLTLILILSLASGLAAPLPAADWPQWRGPARDGQSAEPLPRTLPEGDAPILWQTNVGIGFATVSVAQSRVFTIGHRDEHDVVSCLDAATGTLLWEHRYLCDLDPRYFEGGPCATPTIDGDAVYTFSRKGHVFRLDAATGEVQWERNLLQDYDLELPEWSFSSSPFLFDDLVILNAGLSGLALHRDTGKTVWKSGPEPSGYATPILHRPNPAAPAILLLFGGQALFGLEPQSGKVHWSIPWESKRGVNAADPIALAHRVLISSSQGALLLELDSNPANPPRELWRHQDLRTYFNPGVLHENHVYAIHGTTHGPTELTCIDWETGATRWSQPGFGSGALMTAGDTGILFDKGQLTLFRLTPDRYEPLFQQQILPGKCWTVPVLSHGVIYCRNAAGDLAAVALTPAP